MKIVLHSIFKFFTLMGQARAASALARSGHYEAAKAIMVK